MASTTTQTTTIDRACPMCTDSRFTTTRTVDGWKLSTCKNCGFLYAPTIRENTASEQEFPSEYEPVYRARHVQIHRLLTTLLPTGSTVVDVGAGFGELGLVCRENGRFGYVGFEPASSIVEVALRRGIEIRAELFEEESLATPADAVVLDNVIEHVEDPVGLLTTCANALRPGGVLVVIVPNRYDVRQVIPAWRDANHWIPPEHINYFTSSSLNEAMARAHVDVRPFGFDALATSDWRYWPRAALERVNLYPFGINVVGTVNHER